MIHHPVAIAGKLVLLLILLIVLLVLHSVLTPEQFRVAFVISIASFVVAVIALWVFVFKSLSNPKSRLGKWLILAKEEPAGESRTASRNEFQDMVGERGVALTLLRPSGFAQFGGKRLSVVTEGEFIDKDSHVEIGWVEGPRVVVRRVVASDGETRT